jgi:riboflavin synthase
LRIGSQTQTAAWWSSVTGRRTWRPHRHESGASPVMAAEKELMLGIRGASVCGLAAAANRRLLPSSMFTGIVEETGEVLGFAPEAEAWRLSIAAGTTRAGTAPGDSIAVNGCCLTVTRLDGGALLFDVLEETRRLTNFSTLRPRGLVNLERSLRFDGKVGGHFVTGHIDTLGTIKVFEPRGKDHYLRVALPREFTRYIVHKGSIAIDGISLTIAEVDDAAATLAVWLIPHTLTVTNLREKRTDDLVNLEFDLLGKHVEKLLQTRTP